jgi:hypothetical protein
MPWRRKQTRYAWGTSAENDLRKIIAPYMPANCRSSRSGGLFDVWGIRDQTIYLFQVKRQGRFHTMWGPRRINTLLGKLHASVRLRNARIFVVTRRLGAGNRVEWSFYYREPI